MKKRIIIASVLLFFAISMCFLSYTITDMISENMINTIHIIEEAIILNDTETAITEAEKLNEVWETYYKILSVYVRNDLLENTDGYVGAVSKYLIIDEQNAALLICQDVISSVEHILENEKFNLSNIL